MTYTPLKLNSAFLYCFEHGVFADEDGAGGLGGARCFAVGWADDADAGVCGDGVREAQAVADDGTVFEGAELDVDFVFGGGGGAAYFEGADVAVVCLSILRCAEIILEESEIAGGIKGCIARTA